MKIKGILDRCAFIVNRYNTYQMPPLVVQLAKDYLLLIQKGRSYAACIILRSLIESIANFKLELSCPEKYKAMIDNNEYALYKYQLISSNSELASLVDVKTLNNNLRHIFQENTFYNLPKIETFKFFSAGISINNNGQKIPGKLINFYSDEPRYQPQLTLVK